jgi:hypothetical protein
MEDIWAALGHAMTDPIGFQETLPAALGNEKHERRMRVPKEQRRVIRLAKLVGGDLPTIARNGARFDYPALQQLSRGGIAQTLGAVTKLAGEGDVAAFNALIAVTNGATRAVQGEQGAAAASATDMTEEQAAADRRAVGCA